MVVVQFYILYTHTSGEEGGRGGKEGRDHHFFFWKSLEVYFLWKKRDLLFRFCLAYLYLLLFDLSLLGVFFFLEGYSCSSTVQYFTRVTTLHSTCIHSGIFFWGGGRSLL